MPATLTLNLDNETAAGFAELLKDVKHSEAATKEFNATAAEQSEVIEQTTIAVDQSRRSFVAWSNEMFEFGRNVRAALLCV